MTLERQLARSSAARLLAWIAAVVTLCMCLSWALTPASDAFSLGRSDPSLSSIPISVPEVAFRHAPDVGTPHEQGPPSLVKRGYNVSAGAYTSITVEGSIFAVFMMLSGLMLTFFGLRLIRTTLFFVGFYVGSLIAYSTINNVENTLPLWGQLLIIIASGLVVACLSFCLLQIGLALLGGLLGLTVAIFINSWKPNGLIQSQWGLILFFCLMAAAGVILILVLQKPVIILSTAVFGSYLVFLGIDFFAQTGYAAVVNAYLSGSLNFVLTDAIYGMLAGQVVLTIIGVTVQVIMLRRHKQKTADF